MRRRALVLAFATISLVAATLPAWADAAYHSEHIALIPVGTAPIRSGFVENVHANGPNVYAHEQYVLNGAGPRSTYQVTIMIFASNTTCTGSPTLALGTASIATNAAGNGSAFHVFTPADADGLRGMTVSAMWIVSRASTPEYMTACSVILLD